MYRLGDVQIEEQPMPVPREGGAALARKFRLTGPQPAGGKLYLLAAAGAKIEEVAPDTWKVDDKVTVRVKAPDGAKPTLREADRGKQLLVPLDLKVGGASVDVELAW
jgi:hypothetical protein